MNLIKITTILSVFCLVNVINNNAYAAKNCNINSPTISFGSAFDPTDNTNLNITFASVISVSCTQFNGNYKIRFAAGTYGTIANRYMRSSTPNNLYFNIYTSSSYTTPLGTTNSSDIDGSCSGTCNNTHTIYGRIPA